MSIWVKICGITSVEDAHVAVRAGADSIGLNLVPSSKRRVDEDTARAIARAVGTSVELVLVVADMALAELVTLRSRLGPATLQLHGSEPAAYLSHFLPGAYKAVRIGAPADVTAARGYGGSRLLADAKVGNLLGGSGHTFDWALVRELGRERPLIVAGGLTPDNVATAVEQVRPYGVDTASGVEGADPRRKDPDKVMAFVAAARGAAREAGLDAGSGPDYLPGRTS